MEQQQHPTLGNGKICYLEIPCIDINEAADFYKTVFGWFIRNDDYGNISFDDGVGQVSGMWVTGRKPATEPGIMISIMVNDLTLTSALITANAGKMLQVGVHGMDNIALFSDPAGNIFSLYEHKYIN